MSSDDAPDIPPPLHDRLEDESSEERAELEALWRLLETARRPDDPEQPTLGAAWEALRERRPDATVPLDAPDASLPTDGQQAASSASPRSTATDRTPTSPPRRARSWRRWGAVAVLVGIVVAAGILFSRRMMTVTAPPGTQRTATLPGGSTVELNSGTSLTYRRAFQVLPFVDAKRRVVRLDGEAFFAVAEGPRAFVVETPAARISVEGTRFNVNARSDTDSMTAVTVASGRVRVAARRQPARAVTLDGRGRHTRVSNPRAAPTPPRRASLDVVLAWRADGFAAQKEPLNRVLRELERRYGTPIRLHASVARTTEPVSLYYPKPVSLSTILRDLCTALDLKYRPVSEGYEVFRAAPAR